jgi:hypothetical protein
VDLKRPIDCDSRRRLGACWDGGVHGWSVLFVFFVNFVVKD